MVASFSLIVALLASRPASDLFLAVAGQLRSPSGKEFRTAVWMTNLTMQRTTVLATFLERHPLKSPAATVVIGLGPRETKEIDDLPVRLGRYGVVGAIRFQSDQRIAVTARIYSTTPLGQSTGVGMRVVPVRAGLKKGDEGFIPGVSFDGGKSFRQTTYLVETGGRPIGLLMRLRDAAGREVAHDSFLLEAHEQRSLPIEELARGASVHNGVISIRVTGGSGRVDALGLQIPARNSEGYFVEMTVRRSGRRFGMSTAEVAIYALTALAVVAAILFARREPRE